MAELPGGEDGRDDYDDGRRDDDDRVRLGREFLLRSRGYVFVNVMEHNPQVIDACLLLVRLAFWWCLEDCFELMENEHIDWEWLLFRRWRRMTRRLQGRPDPRPQSLSRSRSRSRSPRGA